MSQGVSIPHLLRVHFANVGHPDARLSPLTLDFQRNNDMDLPEPLDSIIWAENGVGKSSIRTLLFSLLHPSIHDVMKSANGPMDNRKFELYFGAKDTGYVVSEWSMPPAQQQSLAGFEEEAPTLVLGFVGHWPNGVQSTLGDLERHYFMFQPRGPVNFDTLPIRGLAVGTEPAAGAREFMEWFKTEARPLDGRHTTVHREWSNWLGEVGLDPMIFSYQLRMNGGQGGILGLFKNRINTPTDFVHFFLETVMSGDTASDVIEVLNEKRRHIEKQPQWEAECTFVEEALPLLAMLKEEKEAFETAETDLNADRSRAGAIIAGLKEAAAAIKDDMAGAEMEADEIAAQLQELQEEFIKFQDYRSWLRLHECKQKLAEAEKEVAQRREDHATWHRSLKLLRAAQEYEVWRTKVDECKAIEAELAKRRDSNQDVELELRSAGTRYAQVLDREIKKAEHELEQARRVLEEARAELAGNQESYNDVKAELAKVNENIRGINGQMQKREKALQRLILSGALSEVEAPREALTRTKNRVREISERTGELREQSSMLLEERTVLDERARERIAEMTLLQSEIGQMQKTYDADLVRQNHLETDRDLRMLLEQDAIDLAEDGLADRIREGLARDQQELFRLSRLLSEEKETLDTIEQSNSRLYPPPREVANLLRALREDLGIPAFLAAEELDEKYPEDPEEAAKLCTRDPARYMGIMVRTREALEKVRQQEDRIHKPAFPVQISLAEGSVSRSPEDAVVLRPGHHAAYNRQAAEDMIEPLRAGIAEKERRIAEMTRVIQRLNRTLDGLDAFLAEYPDGTLRSQAEQIDGKRTRLDGLEREQEAERDKAAYLKSEIDRLAEEIRVAESERGQCDGAISRLRDFIEDHELHYEELQEQLNAARERAHALEDENLRLEAVLEEQQLAVAQRQEAVFNRNAAVEHRQEKLNDIAFTGGELADITHVTLVEAEQGYRYSLDRYRQVSEKDETLRARLEEKQNMAKQQEKRYRKELGDATERDVQAVLEEGSIAARLTETEQAEQNASKAVGAAEGALTLARNDLREAPTFDADYTIPGGERMPASVEETSARRQELAGVLERLQEQIDRFKVQLQNIKEDLREMGEDRNFRLQKSEELTRHIPEFAEAPPESLPRVTRDLEDLLDGFWDDYRTHRHRYSRTKIALDGRCDDLKDLANDARFQDFPNDKREILKVRDSLMNLTDDIIKEFNIFRNVIKTSLRMSEESVDAIVTRLDAGVSDALHIVNLAKTSSTLPEAMEGWAGRAFLKMEALGNVGETLDQRRGIYQRVIREVLKAGKPIRGLDLVKRALDALVGEKGYRVVIMKPSYNLKTNYFPITDVKGWSDGEKITSVILLYCTMVQLRAVSTGGRPAKSEGRVLSNGMLFLDNPFGEANSMTFVKMQLSMARALNIQLVYTASGNHKHLMARFPRVLRLSQETGQNTNKTFVKATEVSQELRANVNATQVTAAQFGRRRSGIAIPGRL
ncbi:hypothetical protein SCOR_25960 [Sulfidibacter corallicola]|uniref:Chromosome segregation ATPase n=1 Tax=Sulfidibacter corallicola TaxID=2818388 RepID=A0A8A4TRH9_SULCO|nr:hypothetical protein [Sulfidibacter corallicola]QTD52160.1 hypothetical protein J3U87_06765 [Sulfidibacter corallicola]